MGTYLVMINNFRRGFQHKMLFAVTFLLPIILCILIGVIHFDKPSIRVGILVDSSLGSEYGTMDELNDLLKESKGIKYAKAKEATLNTDLITGKYQVILDYRGSDKLNDYKLISYQTKEKTIVLENAFREAITNQEPILLGRLDKKGMSATERNIAVLVSLFMVFSTIYASGIIKDKQSGALNRFQFAKQSSRGYLLGYVLYNFIIIIVQSMLCMIVLTTVQKTVTIGVLEGVVLSILIAAISTIFGTIICLGSKSEVQANITASALTAIMSLLGGTFVAVETMPFLLRAFSLASPVRWVAEILHLLT